MWPAVGTPATPRSFAEESVSFDHAFAIVAHSIVVHGWLCQRFGPVYARRLRCRRGRLGDTWHLDELFVTLQGRRQYLWRAVDEDGDVLDILVQSRRNRRAKDSLWSIDLFRCESAILRSHWVLVVMDQYTRRIVGFGIQAGTVDGRALCRMFNHAIRGLSCPKRLSSDNDPLYRFHQWRANLRVLQVTEVKSVPYVPGGRAVSICATTPLFRLAALANPRPVTASHYDKSESIQTDNLPRARHPTQPSLSDAKRLRHLARAPWYAS